MAQTPTTMQKLSKSQRYRIFIHAALFVLGFSVIFVVGWGGAATIFGQLFREYKQLIARAGGIVVILFGLVTLGVLRIPWLYYDTRPQWQPNQSNRLFNNDGGGVCSWLDSMYRHNFGCDLNPGFEPTDLRSSHAVSQRLCSWVRYSFLTNRPRHEPGSCDDSPVSAAHAQDPDLKWYFSDNHRPAFSNEPHDHDRYLGPTKWPIR